MKDRYRPGIYERDVDECREKLMALLCEYGAKIEFDDDLGSVLVVDEETKEFACI